MAKECIETEELRKAFYQELLRIGLEDTNYLDEDMINKVIQKYISKKEGK